MKIIFEGKLSEILKDIEEIKSIIKEKDEEMVRDIYENYVDFEIHDCRSQYILGNYRDKTMKQLIEDVKSGKILRLNNIGRKTYNNLIRSLQEIGIKTV